MLEDMIQNLGMFLLQFSLGGNVMDQKKWRSSALNKIIQNYHFKKKVSPEEQKAQKEDRFLRKDRSLT